MPTCHWCYRVIDEDDIADILGDQIVCLDCSMYLHVCFCCEFEHNKDKRYYKFRPYRYPKMKDMKDMLCPRCNRQHKINKKLTTHINSNKKI